MTQLPCDPTTNRSTSYTCLHEGLLALTARAPMLEAALMAAKRTYHDHISVEGALIETGRCRILDLLPELTSLGLQNTPTTRDPAERPRGPAWTMLAGKEGVVSDKP